MRAEGGRDRWPDRSHSGHHIVARLVPSPRIIPESQPSASIPGRASPALCLCLSSLHLRLTLLTSSSAMHSLPPHPPPAISVFSPFSPLNRSTYSSISLLIILTNFLSLLTKRTSPCSATDRTRVPMTLAPFALNGSSSQQSFRALATAALSHARCVRFGITLSSPPAMSPLLSLAFHDITHHRHLSKYSSHLQDILPPDACRHHGRRNVRAQCSPLRDLPDVLVLRFPSALESHVEQAYMLTICACEHNPEKVYDS
ncbi:hypothetical protein GY45DRAFT_581187 [Cubamyces sp. BRFM 1775]|nr:hypothetical protein GY45DRAFT_581187 [Cubamyces sp. BRFM 1775]